MLFYYSVIRFWQAVNGVLAIWKRKKNKKSAVDHIQISDTLLHCVSICFFGNKALGGCWTLGNYTLYI